MAKWLPQVEALAHPAVASGLTHCGFGGTLEFVNAALPVLCFPHFGDQATDAMNLIEARAALSLIAPSLADSRDDDPRYF